MQVIATPLLSVHNIKYSFCWILTTESSGGSRILKRGFQRYTEQNHTHFFKVTTPLSKPHPFYYSIISQLMQVYTQHGWSSSYCEVRMHLVTLIITVSKAHIHMIKKLVCHHKAKSHSPRMELVKLLNHRGCG